MIKPHIIHITAGFLEATALEELDIAQLNNRLVVASPVFLAGLAG